MHLVPERLLEDKRDRRGTEGKKKQAEQEGRTDVHRRHGKSSKEIISQIHKGRDQMVAL